MTQQEPRAKQKSGTTQDYKDASRALPRPQPSPESPRFSHLPRWHLGIALQPRRPEPEWRCMNPIDQPLLGVVQVSGVSRAAAKARSVGCQKIVRANRHALPAGYSGDARAVSPPRRPVPGPICSGRGFLRETRLQSHSKSLLGQVHHVPPQRPQCRRASSLRLAGLFCARHLNLA